MAARELAPKLTTWSVNEFADNIVHVTPLLAHLYADVMAEANGMREAWKGSATTPPRPIFIVRDKAGLVSDDLRRMFESFDIGTAVQRARNRISGRAE